MKPITLTIDHLLGKPSPKVAWLLQVGEQLRRERINSTRGSEHANNVPDSNQ